MSTNDEDKTIEVADGDVVWTEYFTEDDIRICELRFYDSDGNRLLTVSIGRDSLCEFAIECVRTLAES